MDHLTPASPGCQPVSRVPGPPPGMQPAGASRPRLPAPPADGAAGPGRSGEGPGGADARARSCQGALSPAAALQAQTAGRGEGTRVGLRVRHGCPWEGAAAGGLQLAPTPAPLHRLSPLLGSGVGGGGGLGLLLGSTQEAAVPAPERTERTEPNPGPAAQSLPCSGDPVSLRPHLPLRLRAAPSWDALDEDSVPDQTLVRLPSRRPAPVRPVVLHPVLARTPPSISDDLDVRWGSSSVPHTRPR